MKRYFIWILICLISIVGKAQTHNGGTSVFGGSMIFQVKINGATVDGANPDDWTFYLYFSHKAQHDQIQAMIDMNPAMAGMLQPMLVQKDVSMGNVDGSGNPTPEIENTFLDAQLEDLYLSINFADWGGTEAPDPAVFELQVKIENKALGISKVNSYAINEYVIDGTFFDVVDIECPDCPTDTPSGPTLAVNPITAGCWIQNGTFDLTSAVGSFTPASATVKYYSDAAGNQEIANPTVVPMPTTNPSANSETINYYAKAVDGSEASDMQTIAVTFYKKPEVTLALGGGATSPVCEGTDVILQVTNKNSFAENSFRFYCDQFSLDVTQGASAYTVSSFSHAGIYKVYATSALNQGGCIDSAQINIGVIPTIPAGDITITASTSVICAGDEVTLTASVDKPEFAGAIFEWQAPVADADKNKATITVKPEFTTSYNVKAKLNGCTPSAAKSTSITVNPAPTLKVTNPAAVCGGTVDLTASAVTAGSTSGLTLTYYTDANCTTLLTDAINAGAGTYYIKGTTAKGCSASAPVTATVNAKPVPTIAVTGNKTEECSGETLTLTASPAAMTEYKWTVNGVAQTAGQAITPTLADGTNTFSLTVKDANNCEGTIAAPVTVSGLKKPTITIDPVENACAGSTINIVATSKYHGGAKEATVAWTGDAVANASSLTTTAELADRDNTYTVTVTDDKGCSGKEEITVKGNKLTVTLSASSTSVTAGTSVTLTATPTWNGSAAPSGVSYTWKKILPAEESLAGTGKTLTVTPDETSTYEVTVRKDGCEASANTEITVQLESFVVSEITGGHPLCKEDDLSAAPMTLAVSASGGKTEYSYEWTYPAGVTATGDATSQLEITALDYTTVANGSKISVTVKDASTPAQSETREFYLSITSLPTVLINTLADGSTLQACLDVPLTLTATVAGVSSGAKFVWATTPATQGATLNAEVGSTGSTKYEVTGTYSGCSATTSVNVNVNPLPDLTLTATLDGGSVTEVCPGAEVTLLASSSDVNDPDKFSWSGATPNNITGTGGLVTAPASGAPEYVVSVTDGSCSNEKKVKLTVYTPGSLAISVDNATVCANTDVVLTASGGSDYVWSGDAVGTGSPFTVTPDGSKSSYAYTVNGKDANGCEAKSATQPITVISAPLLSMAKSELETCATPGATIDLKNAVNTGASVSGALSMLWVYKDGETISDATQNTIVNSDDTYHLFLKSGTCQSAVETVKAIFNALPEINLSIANNKTEPCSGESITLQASGSADATFTYEGTNGSSWLITPENTGTVNKDVKYTVVAKNSKNCPQNGEIIIKVKPLPTIGIDGPTTVCSGSSITLSATGGKDDNSYQWEDGSLTKDHTVTPSSTVHEYTVVGTGANGCTNQAKTTITLQEAPQITIQPLADICEGIAVELEDAVLTELSLKFYEQDKTTQLASSKVTKDVAGSYTYYVQGTQAGIDCPSGMEKITFTVKPKPVLAFLGNQTICEGKSTTITVNGATNGITWKDNNSTDNPRMLNPTFTTTYTVTGKGSNSCTAEENIEIIVNLKPQIDWNAVTQGITSVVEGANLSVGIQLVKGTTTPYEYSWKHNGVDIANNDPSYNTTAAGIEEKFAVCVKDAKGCVSDTIKKDVEVTPQGGLLTVTLAASSDKICQGGMQILTATPAGGSGNYQYTWYKDGADMGLAADVNTIIVTDAATYKVAVTDDGTIQQNAETSKIITIDNGHMAPVVTVDNMTIISGTSTVLFSQVTPANGDYTYVWEDKGLVAGEAGKPYPRTEVLTADQDYKLYVKDNQGCISKKATGTVTVDASAFKVVAEAESQNSPICIGGKAWLNAKITGVSVPAEEDLTYTWLPADGGLSATNVKNPVFTSSAQGVKEYFVKVEDKNGRIAGASVQVSVNNFTTAVLSLTTQDNAKCSGEIQVVADKTFDSYSWIIDKGSVETGNSNKTLTAGKHEVQVFGTDKNGCPSDTLRMDYEIFTKPEIAWDVNNTWKVDAGDLVTIKAVADGGADGNYTYNWIAPASGTKTGNACSVIINGKTTFKVSVKNEDTGCESAVITKDVEMRLPKPPVVITTNIENGLLCDGGSNMLEVTSVTGGNGSGDFADYTIKWYKDGTEIGSGRTLVVSAAGTYTVKVSDSEDRSATKDIAITISSEAAPQVADGLQTVAVGHDTYLAGTVSGGKPVYVYKWWSDAAGFVSADDVSNPKTMVFNTVGAKDYHYYVTDANNCVSDVATVTVNVVESGASELFAVTASADRTPICMNNSTVLRAKTSRPLTNPTYLWIPSEGLDNETDAAPKFTPTTAGTYTYTVKVTEDGGTSVTAQVKVVVNNMNAPVLALSSNGDCAGELLTVTNTGESASATGYHWEVNGVTVAETLSQYALGEGTNQYVKVSAISANGCAADTVAGVFTRKPTPELTWSTTAGKNEGVTVGEVIEMQVVPTPENDAMTYTWQYTFTPEGGSEGAKTDGSGSEDLQLFAPNAGTYKFFVSATLDGCTSKVKDKEIIVEPEGAKLAVSTDATTYTVCEGGSAVITATAENGDGNYTYSWYKGASVTGAPVASGAVAAIAPTMNNEKYTVQVTDGAGKKATATVTLKFSSEMAPVVSSYVQTAIAGSTTVLMSSVTGVSASYDYTWAPEGLLATGEAKKSHPQTVALTNTTPDYYTYTYFVKDDNGCVSAPGTVKVNVETAPDALAIKATTDNATLCKGNKAHLDVVATQGALSASAQYEWSPVSSLSAANVANPVFTASAAGVHEYVVKVIDNGKTLAAKVSITVNDAVAPTIVWASGNPPANYKKGQELKVQVKGQGGSGSGYVYHWLSPAPASVNSTGIYSVNPANADQYDFEVYVTDGNNCASSDTLRKTIMPEEKEKIQIEISADNVAICAVKEGAATAELAVTLTKGPAVVEYEWVNKANSLTITDDDKATAKVDISGITPGSYTFQVKVSDPDYPDNYAMTDVKLTIWSLPVISWVNASPAYQVGDPLKMQVKATNGEKPYSFGWHKPLPATTGDTYEINPTTEGSYYFEAYAEDKNGCRDSINTTITAGSAPAGEILVEVTDARSCAMAAGSGETADLVATVTSDHTNVSYDWKAKAGNTLSLTDANQATAKVDIAGVAAGSYVFEVTVTDLDNTSNKVTKDVTLTIQAAPQVSINEGTHLALHKDEAFNLNIANKSENYSYIWAVSVYDMLSDSWSDPVNEGISNSVSGVMKDKDMKYVLTATDVMSDLKCKASDTTTLYRIPDAPELTIDTNTNRLDIKLKWAAVNMAEGYTIWSRKWDPYVMTSADGAKYSEESSTKSTFWAEPSMDTLEFYYVTADRTIDGVTYYSHTSDTVGYKLDKFHPNTTTGNQSNWHVAWMFDMSAYGVTESEDVLKRMKTTVYLRGWNVGNEGWVYQTIKNPLFGLPGFESEKEYSGSFVLEVGQAYQFDTPNGSDGFLQYGKLPGKIEQNFKTVNSKILNMGVVPFHHADKNTAANLMDSGLDGNVYIIRKWNFMQQGWLIQIMRNPLFGLPGFESEEKYSLGNEIMKPGMALQIDMGTLPDYIWK